MPIKKFQKDILKLLAKNRSPESHLAGATAINKLDDSPRFSDDLDFFHDTLEIVNKAFHEDKALLIANKYKLEVEINQPGFIRAVISKDHETTKIDWARDSAWRFMPTINNPEYGYQLHPIDLAINKTLALVGRDEPRDFLDILYINKNILPLGGLIWAAVGKDPGYTPISLLEMLKRRGRYQLEDFNRLILNQKIDLVQLKQEWLQALETAEKIIEALPSGEIGCLYYSPTLRKFIVPDANAPKDTQKHFGRISGVLPQLYEGETLIERFESSNLDK